MPSDGLGLHSVALAVAAVGGKVCLSTYEDVAGGGRQHTVFHLRLPAVPGTAQDEEASFQLSSITRNRSSVQPALDHEARPTSPARSLVCVGLDDSISFHRILKCLFQDYLGADLLRSCCLGASASEAECAVAVALGKLDAKCSPANPPLAPADVVVLDQHLTYGAAGTLVGSELAAQLREQGFEGVVRILTGSTPQVRVQHDVV